MRRKHKRIFIFLIIFLIISLVFNIFYFLKFGSIMDFRSKNDISKDQFLTCQKVISQPLCIELTIKTKAWSIDPKPHRFPSYIGVDDELYISNIKIINFGNQTKESEYCISFSPLKEEINLKYHSPRSILCIPIPRLNKGEQLEYLLKEGKYFYKNGTEIIGVSGYVHYQKSIELYTEGTWVINNTINDTNTFFTPLINKDYMGAANIDFKVYSKIEMNTLRLTLITIIIALLTPIIQIGFNIYASSKSKNGFKILGDTIEDSTNHYINKIENIYKRYLRSQKK